VVAPSGYGKPTLLAQWAAAGLYLAALHLREGGSLRDAENAFGGDDRLVSQYLESVRSRQLELLDA
jgi:hypothetical protein